MVRQSRAVIASLLFGAVAGFSRVALAQATCSSVFNSPVREDVEILRHSMDPPAIHLGNYRQKNLPLGTSYVAKGSREKLRTGLLWYGKGETQWMRLTRLSDDRSFFEMEALLGARYFRNEIVPEGLKITAVRFEETPFFVGKPVSTPEPPRTFSLAGRDLNDVAEKVAASQQPLSNTIRNSTSTDSALINANLLALKALKENRELTTDFLDLVNFEVLGHAVKSGVTRGTAMRLVEYAEGPKWVDLKNAQMKNRDPEFWYLPASEVPRRIERWLKDANSVGPGTPLPQIVSLYRDYIVIHPHANGNGRTARVFVDYLLMKAGFGPVPHRRELTEDVLHASLDQLSSRFAEAFRRK